MECKVTARKSHYRNEKPPYELPTGWEWCCLGDVMGIVSAKRVLQSEWQKQGVPFYRAREIARLSETGFVNNELFISREHYESLKKTYGVPCVGDIMMSAVGTIGKCYIVRESDCFYYKDASVLCLRNSFHLSPEYVVIYLQSSLARQQMFEESKGTTVDTITIEKASNYLIPIPPLPEQRRIVGCTEIILKKVEELTVQVAAIKQLVQETKDKIIENALKGKLVPQDPEEEPAIETLRRINPSFQPSHNLHYGCVLPSGWTIARLGDIIEIVPGTSFQKTDIVTPTGGIKILRGGNIQNGRIVICDDDVYISETLVNDRANVKKGDIVIVASTGSSELIGKAALSIQDYPRTQIGAFLRIIRPLSSELSDYLGIIFQSEIYKKHIREVAKGTNINNIKASYITEFIIPIPPLAEQQRIIEKVGSLFWELTHLIPE